MKITMQGFNNTVSLKELNENTWFKFTDNVEGGIYVKTDENCYVSQWGTQWSITESDEDRQVLELKIQEIIVKIVEVQEEENE